MGHTEFIKSWIENYTRKDVEYSTDLRRQDILDDVGYAHLMFRMDRDVGLLSYGDFSDHKFFRLKTVEEMGKYLEGLEIPVPGNGV